MPIYDKPCGELIRDMISEFRLQKGQTFTRRQAVDWFSLKYPKLEKGTVTAHLRKLSTNDRNRLHHHVRLGEDNLLFRVDHTRYRLYEAQSDPPPITKADDVNRELREDCEEDASDGMREFAYEHDLRDYLAKNLHLIEHGLRLYEQDGIEGIEFDVDGRLIDILALDKSNNYVVIELKVSRGYDRVVGQLLRYMAWIEKEHADSGQSVRGVIVAREISKDLRLACSKLRDVRLFEYELSVHLKQVPGVS